MVEGQVERRAGDEARMGWRRALRLSNGRPSPRQPDVVHDRGIIEQNFRPIADPACQVEHAAARQDLCAQIAMCMLHAGRRQCLKVFPGHSFHKTIKPNLCCRRPIKMSPLCQLEMTLPGGFPGGVGGDGSADERWGAVAAGGAARSGSVTVDDEGSGAAAGARAASGVPVVEGLSDRGRDGLDLEATRAP